MVMSSAACPVDYRVRRPRVRQQRPCDSNSKRPLAVDEGEKEGEDGGCVGMWCEV